MCDTTIKKIFNDRNIIKCLSEKQNEQRKIGRYCDYELKTEDGGSFTVHKSVLESNSTFFEKMLNSQIIGKNKESLLIRECSTNVLENIIEFMYTGKIELTSDIAKQTLDIALFLGLNTLVDACTKILVEFVNIDNCFELLSYSETYHCGDDLTKKCLKIICENIHTLKNSLEFMNISSDSMKTLISYDRNILNEFHEEEFYLLIIQWIKYDIDNRKKFISNFIDKIKFDKISLRFGIEKILKDCFLLKNEEFTIKIHDIISKNWEQQLTMNINKTILSSKMENLYSIIDSEIILYNPGIDAFSTIITEISNNNSGCSYSIFANKQLFVGGGQINGEYVNTCNYYSMLDKNWNVLPSMEISRYRSRAITLHNKIYVCGGNNEKTVEIFDINKIQWDRGPSFDREINNIGLCLYNEIIYGVHEFSLQFLDIRTYKWTELPLLSVINRSSRMYSAINHNTYIYGFSFRGIHTFDIRANKWFNDMKLFEKNYTFIPSSCKNGNEIYVLGRTDIGTYLLHSFNISDFSNYYCQTIKTNKQKEVCYLFSL